MKNFKHLRLMFIASIIISQMHGMGTSLTNNKDARDSPILMGSIDNKYLNSDGLMILFQPDLLIPKNKGLQSISVEFDTLGKFRVTLPRIKRDIGQMYIQVIGKNGGVINRIPYYVENTDSINLTIRTDNRGVLNHKISGKGCAKYWAIENISRIWNLRLEPVRARNFYNNKDSFEKRVKELVVLRNSAVTVLKYYRHQISELSYSLMKTDILGRYNLGVISTVNRFLANNLSLDYLRYLEHSPLQDRINVLSKSYIEHLIQNSITKNKTQSEQTEGYSVGDVYELLKSEYKGILKDKLITNYLSGSYYRVYESNKDNQYEQLLNEAIKEVHSSELNEVLKEIGDKYSKGSIVYDFALPDMDGELVKLSDFKNKVVLIDIYATRCTGCRVFAKTLKEKVYSAFADNTSVQFIAISVEKDKEIWLMDLKEENNTSPKHSLCLYTEGMGENHPLINYYQVKAYPTILLVGKDGKLFSSSKGKLNAMISGEELVNLIQKALNN